MFAVGTSIHPGTLSVNPEPIHYPSIPLSRDEVECKAITELHSSSRLESREELQAWSPVGPFRREPEDKGKLSIPLQPFPEQDSPTMRVVLLKERTFRGESGYLCLQQELAADTSAVAHFMTDLEGVLERLGNRATGSRIWKLE